MAPRDPPRPDGPFIPRASSVPAQAPARSGKLRNLEALFSKGGAPGVAGPARPQAAGAMESRMRRERLRAATAVEEIAAAADSLLKHFEMPDEPDLLCKMLAHPDAGVGERALAQLGSLHQAGKLAVTLTMKDALAAFQPRCREPMARAVLEELLH